MAGDRMVLIIGCGRLGASLANRLSARGDAVVTVDIDSASFSRLAPDYSGFKVEGDASELATMNQSGAGKADLLLAVTGNDNVNIHVCQVASAEYNAPRVIARISDAKKQSVFRRLGVETLSATEALTKNLLDLIDQEAR